MKTHTLQPSSLCKYICIGVLTIFTLTACGQHSLDGRSSFTDGKDSYEDPPSSSSGSDEPDDNEIYVGGDGEDEEIIEDEEETEEEEDIYEEE